MNLNRREVISLAVAASCIAPLSTLASQSASAEPGVERLYILYCGEGTAGDISLWSLASMSGRPWSSRTTAI